MYQIWTHLSIKLHSKELSIVIIKLTNQFQAMFNSEEHFDLNKYPLVKLLITLKHTITHVTSLEARSTPDEKCITI